MNEKQRIALAIECYLAGELIPPHSLIRPEGLDFEIQWKADEGESYFTTIDLYEEKIVIHTRNQRTQRFSVQVCHTLPDVVEALNLHFTENLIHNE